MAVRRNIGIIAHIDAGKTTLTEKLLHASGTIRRAGAVDDGSTISDWQRQEQERGITIGSAAMTCKWRDLVMTIVDTPGHVDFTIEVTRCLHVLDGAIVVFSGPDGVQAQTLTNWVHVVERGLPAIGFVNKLDQAGFDEEHVLADIQLRLGIIPLPLQIPIHVERTRLTLLDVISGARLTWDKLEKKSGVREPTHQTGQLSKPLEIRRVEALDRIADAVIDYDDEFAERYLNDELVSQEIWLRALRAATLARHCLPLFYGCARAGVGPGELLTWLPWLLPEPEVHPFSRRLLSSVDSYNSQAPVVAYVFKTEPRGAGTTIAFIRVFSGEVRQGQSLFAVGDENPVKVQSLLRLFGGEGEEVSCLEAGEIGGLVFDDVHPPFDSGSTLSTDAEWGHRLEMLSVPSPVIALKVEAQADADHQRMRQALERLVVHDPSMAVLTDAQTGDTLLAGMGNLHLELALERLRVDEGLDLRHGAPQPRNRALVLKPATAQSNVTVHDATHGYVELTLSITPRAPDQSSEAIIEIDAGLNSRWVSAAIAGVEGVVIHDHDVVHVTVCVEALVTQGGSVEHRHVWQAARDAAVSALAQADLWIAEPWMHVSILVPNDAVGRVSGDLARRRARIVATISRDTVQVLTVESPLAEMIEYATALRSLTGGMGTFTMRPAGYRPLAGRSDLII